MIYDGEAYEVQNKSDTACFLVIIPSRYCVQTFIVPLGKPVKSEQIKRCRVGLMFVDDITTTNNSDRTKNGNKAGITDEVHNVMLFFTDANTVFEFAENSMINKTIKMISRMFLNFFIVDSMQ